MKNTLKLVIPTEQTLTINANLGDGTYSFSLVIPHWNFAKKLAVGKEFRDLGKEVSDALSLKLEATKQETVLGQKTFDEFREAMASPETYDNLKKFVLKHVLALADLTINIVDENNPAGEKEVINLIRKEHESFAVILDELWAYDAIINAILTRFAEFFKH